MRTIKNIAVLAAFVCAAAFTSCNVNDDIDSTNEAVRFTAGIDKAATPQGAPVSRAAGTTWGNDAIGVFMVANGTTTIAENAENKKYTTTGGGTFTAATTGDAMYYPMSGNTVDFIAYYPYKDVATLGTAIDVEIAATQADATQPLFDLLWTKADNGGAGYNKVSHETNPVALTFTHKLAKIVMNCTADDNVGESLDAMRVTIKGMNTKNKFDLATGTLGNPETKAPITPREIATAANFEASYDAIIMPGNYSTGDVTVEFTISTEETFTWTLDASDASFVGGNEYTYAVTLTRTGVKVIGSITPWITFGNDRGPVTAE